MRLWRIIATATVVEVAFGAMAVALLGLGGAWNGWLDLINQLAPLWFTLSLLAAAGAALLIPPSRRRWLVVGMAAVGVVASGPAVAPELVAAIGPFGRPAEPTLKVVTFNTWSDNTDPEAVIARLQQADADVVALLEMGAPLIGKLRQLDAIYPYRTTPKHGCPSDTRIFSKRPFSAFGCRVVQERGGPMGDLAVVWGRTTAPDGHPVLLAATHYAWPIPGGAQAMQKRALARWVAEAATPDTILVGDFNLAPWSQSLKAQDRALRPLTRRDHAIATWPAMIARLNRPSPFALLAIDHIYAGPAWRTVDVHRLGRAGSDHYPVEATFKRQ